MSEVQLEGQLVSGGRNTIKRLIASIPAIELINVVEPELVFQGLEFFFNAAKNKINKERVAAIQRDIEGDLHEGILGPVLSLTLVLSGRANFVCKGNTAVLSYDRKQAVVVSELLVFIAILNVLRIKAPLFSSRLSSKNLDRNSHSRQALAIEDITVTVIFSEQGINGDQVRELFYRFHRQNSGIHLTQLDSTTGDFPLKKYVRQLAVELELDSLGGVSSQSKHIKATERYVTSEYILFKVLVGAVAPPLVQERCQMSEDVIFNRGEYVSKALSDGGMHNIVAFFGGWLKPLCNDETSLRDGFRLSAQIWQALSLVINDLVSEGATIEQLSDAGETLGLLDYGKKASHWRNCDVMELDSNGRLFKSSAKSTREFRVGLKKYFISCLY